MPRPRKIVLRMRSLLKARHVQPTKPLVPEPVTALAKRKSLLPPIERFVTQESSCCFRESDVRRLTLLVSCTECACACRYVEGKARHGSWSVVCSACSHVMFSSEREFVTGIDGKRHRCSRFSLAQVYDSLLNATGYAGYVRSCVISGLTKLSFRAYRQRVKFFQESMSLFVREQQPRIHIALARVYEAESADDAKSVLDVAVSFDGTWMTRGHSSHVGVAVVIECETGFVLDFEVLSNYCKTCVKQQAKLSQVEFAAWEQTHTACTRNFEGKFGAMEAEAAVRLWGRSRALGYRYTVLIGDGDSSAFNAIRAMNSGAGPYSVPVVIEECVNHLSKRLGTRLRNLKKRLPYPVTTKNGKVFQRSLLGGQGSLTDDSIAQLERFYGQTIRKHDHTASVESLCSSILSSYYHARSTDARPRHQNCPQGETSWCWVRRAEAEGKTPGPHSDHRRYLSGLSQKFLKQVLLVYADFTRPELLARCLKKWTQKPNESLHSKLRVRCWKAKFAQLESLRFAVSDTIMTHNFGSTEGCLFGRLGLISEDGAETQRAKDESTEAAPKRRRLHRALKADEPSF